VTYRYLANQTDSHGPHTGSASYSIWADGRIRSNEFNAVSDERIKKDIVDVVDASALEKLRLLKPKTYKYKDTLARTNQTVYGFIAQEVANVIPYAVSTATDSIPNILTTSSVTRNDTFFPPDSNVYYMPSNVHVSESSNIFDIHLDTSIPGLSLSNTSTISITTDKDVNDTFSVVKHEGDVITITSGKEIETTNVFSNVSNAYIYGEVVSDFNNLNKDSIWTISCAALQEVDRQLQAEKTKVATLETQVANLLARVTALENN
jgi:predicted transcriptional regulator